MDIQLHRVTNDAAYLQKLQMMISVQEELVEVSNSSSRVSLLLSSFAEGELKIRKVLLQDLRGDLVGKLDEIESLRDRVSEELERREN